MTLTPRHYAVLSALAALCVLLLGAMSAAHNIGDHDGDVWHYYTVSGLTLGGEWPYRDFMLEYPAFALLPMVLARLAIAPFSGGYAAYVWAFLAESALLTAVLTWTILTLSAQVRGPRAWLPTFLLLIGLVIFSPTLEWRYDLFPALLTALALQSLLAARPFRAGVWLGLGVAAKLYPLILLPLFFLYLYMGSQRRAGLRLVLGCAAAVVVCLLPFVTLPLPVLLSFLKYHEMRGLEIECVAAGAVLLAHLAGLTPVSVVFNYGADHIVSPAAPPIIRCLPALFMVFYGGVLWKTWRSFRSEQVETGAPRAETLVVFLIGSLLAFILANKVFSPQYMLWLLPFVPLMQPRRVLLLAATFVLTAAIYPYAFDRLLLLTPRAILLLNLRNALALVFFGSLLWLRHSSDDLPSGRSSSEV